MPVDVEDAEAYELPPLAGSSTYLPDDEAHDPEAAGLLNGKVVQDETKHFEAPDEGDIVGKGTKIDNLIAEVRLYAPVLLVACRRTSRALRPCLALLTSCSMSLQRTT